MQLSVLALAQPEPLARATSLLAAQTTGDAYTFPYTKQRLTELATNPCEPATPDCLSPCFLLLIAALALGGVIDPVMAFALLGLTLATFVTTVPNGIPQAQSGGGSSSVTNAVSGLVSASLLEQREQQLRRLTAEAASPGFKLEQLMRTVAAMAQEQSQSRVRENPAGG